MLSYITDTFRRKRPFYIGVSVYFISFLIILFIQLSDYMRSYILYIRAKKKLLDMYRAHSTVLHMKDQAAIVQYFHDLCTDGVQQIFYFTAAFTFVGVVFVLMLVLVKKISER